MELYSLVILSGLHLLLQLHEDDFSTSLPSSLPCASSSRIGIISQTQTQTQKPQLQEGALIRSRSHRHPHGLLTRVEGKCHLSFQPPPSGKRPRSDHQRQELPRTQRYLITITPFNLLLF
jgi:hypothetical protein